MRIRDGKKGGNRVILIKKKTNIDYYNGLKKLDDNKTLLI